MKVRTSASMTYVTLISSAAALGGFLFGYDTAVVSGAIGFLRSHFNLTAELTGWAASSVLIGCMFGAMAGGPLGDRIGRKSSLIICAVLFAGSSLASALSGSLSQFAWARFAGGLAIGSASILSPVYIAEIAPERIRGRLVSLYQLAIVVGILAVFFVNLQIQRQGDESWNIETGWRWMFGSLILPSVLFGILIAAVPESPRWLVRAGHPAKALSVLERISGRDEALRELQAVEATVQTEGGRWDELLRSGVSRALLVGSALAVFSQLSGINAIMYYAPEIFKAAGSEPDSAFLQTVTVGAVNLAFTFIALWLVDKAGRKPLLLVGTAVQALSLSGVAWAFWTERAGWPLLLGVLTFVAAFAMAMGPVSWIVNSEIFPNRLRGRAMAVSIFLLWLACFAVSQTFPMIVEAAGPASTFMIYGGFSLLSMVFVLFLVPETKGRSLEEIEAGWKLAARK